MNMEAYMKPKKASRKPPESYKKNQGRIPEIISLLFRDKLIFHKDIIKSTEDAVWSDGSPQFSTSRYSLVLYITVETFCWNWLGNFQHQNVAWYYFVYYIAPNKYFMQNKCNAGRKLFLVILNWWEQVILYGMISDKYILNDWPFYILGYHTRHNITRKILFLCIVHTGHTRTNMT